MFNENENTVSKVEGLANSDPENKGTKKSLYGAPTSIPEKIEMERLNNYAHNHNELYNGKRIDGQDYFCDWINRTRLALALLEAVPPLRETAYEMLKTIVEQDWLTASDNSKEYIEWDLNWQVECLYHLAQETWERLGDGEQALNYLDKAMAIVEQEATTLIDRAQGEIFYSRLKLLKGLGRIDTALLEISAKAARFQTEDGLSNSYLFFSALFQAELAKEQNDLTKAFAELMTAARYYPYSFPEYVEIKETAECWSEESEETWRLIMKILENYSCLYWDYDGTFRKHRKQPSPLYRAIVSCDEAKALHLIAQRDGAEPAIEEVENLLVVAVRQKCMTILEALLQAGYNPNFTDNSNGLISNALRCPSVFLERLLNAGLSPDGNQHRDFPLLDAVKLDSLDHVEILLAAGADCNREGVFGRTPLLEAAVLDGPEILHRLIAAGANVHCKNGEGKAPLVLAAGVGNMMSLQVLLEAGADQGEEILEQALAETVKGTHRGHLHMAEYLLSWGVNVGKPGKAYLREPAANGNIEMMQLLIAAGAGVNDEDVKVNRDIRHPLIDYDRELKARLGITPLSRAAQCGQLEAIRLLLKEGALVNHSDEAGLTPLIYACLGGEAEAAALLVEAGANLDDEDMMNKTALDYALELGHYLAAQALEEAINLRQQETAKNTQPTQEKDSNKSGSTEREAVNLDVLFEGLVGLGSVKREFTKLVRLFRNSTLRDEALGKAIPINCNLIIEGDEGSGKFTVAQRYVQVLKQMGIIKKETMQRIGREELESYRGIENMLDKQKNRIWYIEDIDTFLPDKPDKKRRSSEYNHINKILGNMIDHNQENIFIIAVKPGTRQEMAQETPIDKLFHFTLEMPGYSSAELNRFAQAYAAERGYRLNPSALRALAARSKALQEADQFQWFNSIGLMLDKAMFSHACQEDYTRLKAGALFKLKKEHLEQSLLQTAPTQAQEEHQDGNPFAELDDLIGLHDVKRLVREIAAYYSVQKKKGETLGGAQPLCLHMVFSGNPGTGKTTVARIVGKIFRQLGLLPKGHFTEVSRVDLVGQFVGHSADKCQSVINKAMGGVMFIDEAYSLNVDSGRDFGHEVVSTLLQAMENKRDQFSVIFAGYDNEMDAFLDMNPGLRSRVQFKVHFPDYAAVEMMEIFLKMCREEMYQLDDSVRNEMLEIFEKLCQKKSGNFANGRLARVLFERVKLEQAARLFETKGMDIEPSASVEWTRAELMKITIEDVKAMLENPEIRQLMRPQSRKIIGFSGQNWSGNDLEVCN